MTAIIRIHTHIYIHTYTSCAQAPYPFQKPEVIIHVRSIYGNWSWIAFVTFMQISMNGFPIPSPRRKKALICNYILTVYVCFTWKLHLKKKQTHTQKRRGKKGNSFPVYIIMHFTPGQAHYEEVIDLLWSIMFLDIGTSDQFPENSVPSMFLTRIVHYCVCFLYMLRLSFLRGIWDMIHL